MIKRNTWLGLVALLLVLSLALVIWLYGNFHAVIPGQIYRSAQLPANILAYRIKKYGFRSVINLRGAHPEKSWYQKEKNTVEQLGARQYDLALNAEVLPAITELETLIQWLATAPRPLLLHCQHGADRTGMASAVALLLEGKKGMAAIQQQVSFRYYVTSQHSAGRQLLLAYQAWLAKQKIQHNPDRFRHWVKNEYIDENGNMVFYIDAIGEQRWKGNEQYQTGHRFQIDRSKAKTLVVKGWALDLRHRTLVKQVEVLLGDYALPPAQHNRPNAGVVKLFGSDYHHASWFSEQPMASLPVGCHELRMRITRLDNTVWLSPPKARVCL